MTLEQSLQHVAAVLFRELDAYRLLSQDNRLVSFLISGSKRPFIRILLKDLIPSDLYTFIHTDNT